ncbi:hypothetical protein P7C71_g548, partial [Lecanoromycetidae sp. Uapishka_2]
MFGFDDAQQAQQQCYDDQGNPQQPDNQGSFSHEVLAGGAGFMAMRQYQKHEEANGVAENHTVAKDLMAGFAGAEADKLVETHGENFYDREKMKHDATDQANSCYDQQYGVNQGGDSGYQGGGDSGNY